MMNFSLSTLRHLNKSSITGASGLIRSLSTTVVESSSSSSGVAAPAEPLPRPLLDEFGRAYATGRRKSSVARVWLKDGSGQFSVNGKGFIDFFQPMQRQDIIQPFAATNTSCLYDVVCTVKGGGISGQAGAVRLGVSRALEKFSSDFRAPLKEAGLLTRDARRVERKKPGQKKARKQYQWVKR